MRLLIAIPVILAVVSSTPPLSITDASATTYLEGSLQKREAGNIKPTYAVKGLRLQRRGSKEREKKIRRKKEQEESDLAAGRLLNINNELIPTDEKFQYLHNARLDPGHAPNAVDEDQKLKVNRWFALHERTMGKFREPSGNKFERTSGRAVGPALRKEVVHTLAVGPVEMHMPDAQNPQNAHVTWRARVFSFDKNPDLWRPPASRREAELRRSTWMGRIVEYDQHHWNRLLFFPVEEVYKHHEVELVTEAFNRIRWDKPANRIMERKSPHEKEERPGVEHEADENHIWINLRNWDR